MSRPFPSPPAGNHLLSCLTRADRKRLIAQSEAIDLIESDVLCHAGDRIRHVYFPIDSFVSLITPIGESGFESGLVGPEGVFGISLVLGVDISPQRGLVQGPGSALRMPAAAFRRELARSLPLRRVLDRYLYAVICQLAQSGACTRFHVIEARLARWLLMSHDRSPGDQFHLTHEFLAYMLGVRRGGITVAAGALQKRKLITYVRGNITILDRAGLEAASCACYRIDRETYARMLP
jgi:CRP-like cAMP-binding protein